MTHKTNSQKEQQEQPQTYNTNKYTRCTLGATLAGELLAQAGSLYLVMCLGVAQ